VPLVDLALTQLQALGDAADELAGPVGVLQELVLKDLQLLLVFPLSALNVPASNSVVILGLLKQLGDALVQIVKLQFIVGDVEGGLLRGYGAVFEHGRGAGALEGVA
jgi:hypothetical protein